MLLLSAGRAGVVSILVMEIFAFKFDFVEVVDAGPTDRSSVGTNNLLHGEHDRALLP